MVTLCKYKNMILLFLLVIIQFLGIKGSRGYERSLHAIPNMPNVIKTFQEDNGDIIDCFDIYKQPTLAHPLLKNHKVQLSPQSISQTMFLQNSKNTSLETSFKLSKCPKGYVPIKRSSNDDLSREDYLNYYASPKSITSQNLKFYDARGIYAHEEKIHGAKGFMSVWSIPPVSRTQSCETAIWITDNSNFEFYGHKNAIIAGWRVDPSLFNDTKTRLFNYWSVYDGPIRSYCYNIECPGFVQVNSRIYLGSEIEPLSIYDGEIYEIEVQIFQDLGTGHWWLEINDELVGYWPKTLFTRLQDGANYASWGGHATSLPNEPSPPMGSGHKPRYKNTGKVAYVREMQVNRDAKLYGAKQGVLEMNSDDCYNVVFHEDETSVWDGDNGWRNNVIYGGPGGCI